MINYSQESEHAKEMALWEMRPTREVSQDMIDEARRAGKHHGVFTYQEYPKAMYKAEQTPNGIKIPDDAAHRPSVASAVEEQNMRSRGYRTSSDDAIKAVEEVNQAAAVADAERNFTDRRMSKQARAEADAAEQATSKHVGEIPATPIQRRGRKAKVS